jgi:DGQHR domain-containing protein
VNPIPAASDSVKGTPDFDFISGHYSASAKPVTYFTTVMSFADAASSLRLISELPGSTSLDWAVEELYQREIDWRRVRRGIVPYLKQTDSPQFFNSITVALLPQAAGKLVAINDHPWNPPAFSKPSLFSEGCIKHFGPITCGYWGKWTQPSEATARLGRIKWNPDQIAAVAIDGQHRLAAIKELLRQRRQEISSSVPVILVVSHPDLGSVDAGDAAASLLLTRRLFIDLNKHSVKVSRARQILLDDRNPVSLCTRTLVCDRLSTGDEALTEARLPLTLVDWHSEQAKFDTGPYLTTILGLDWLVERCINVSPTLDPMAHDEIEHALLEISNSLEIDLDDAKERLAKAKRSEAPFEFTSDDPDSDLARITESFRLAWAPAIVYLIAELLPYRGLRDLRRSKMTLRPDFAGWWAAKSRKDSDRPGAAGDALTTIEDELRHQGEVGCTPDEFENSNSEFESWKADRELAFAVTFQRALFLAYLTFLRSRLIIRSESSEVDGFVGAEPTGEVAAAPAACIGAARLEYAKFFVSALNRIAEKIRSFYQSSCTFGASPARFLWGGSLYTEESGTIDFTAAASKRASDLILAIVLLSFIRANESDMRSASFRKLRSAIEEASGAGAATGVYSKLCQAVNRMAKDGLAYRTARARAEPADTEDELEESAREEAFKRLEYIWRQLEA